ncbi:unnamed protein product [Penicillium bialowiezense]
MASFDMEILIRIITVFNNCRDVGMSDIIFSYRFREFTGADITDILVNQPFPESTEPVLFASFMMREYERVYHVKPELHRFCVDN